MQTGRAATDLLRTGWSCNTRVSASQQECFRPKKHSRCSTNHREAGALCAIRRQPHFARETHTSLSDTSMVLREQADGIWDPKSRSCIATLLLGARRQDVSTAGEHCRARSPVHQDPHLITDGVVSSAANTLSIEYNIICWHPFCAGRSHMQLLSMQEKKVGSCPAVGWSLMSDATRRKLLAGALCT